MSVMVSTGRTGCGHWTYSEIPPESVIWSRRQSIIAANALYQIEVDHVSEVVFHADMVKKLLG